MNDRKLSIGSAVDVDFNHVEPCGKGAMGSLNRILRGELAGTAMTDNLDRPMYRGLPRVDHFWPIRTAAQNRQMPKISHAAGVLLVPAHDRLAAPRGFGKEFIGQQVLGSVHVFPAQMDHVGARGVFERVGADGHQRGPWIGAIGLRQHGGRGDCFAFEKALDQLAAFARDESLWFHVDGAFGASAILSPNQAPGLKGIEQADSLAFDFHKWMHVNYDAGCVLIRDQDLHRRAFANRPDYLAANGRALAGGDPWPVDFGPELSRGFRALKVWAHLLEHGTQKIGDMITKNCAQASYMGALVEGNSNLELLAPVSLNISCFRFISDRMNGQQLDDLNAEIVDELQLRGIAAPSTTRLDGRLAIRVNLTNHRTQLTDIDMLHDAVDRLGRTLSGSG